MAIAQPNTQPQTLVPPKIALQTVGLSQVHIKGPSDDGLGDGLDYGLDDLIRGYTVRRPDERRKIKVKHTSKTNEMIKQFSEVLKLNKDDYYLLKFKEHLEKTLTDVLTPTEIGIFFQAVLYKTENMQLDDQNDLTSERIGMFTTQLIQLSYNAGNNDFVLGTENSQRIISQIGFRLKGNKKQLVKIRIRGDVAAALCINSSYCEIDVDGDIHNNGYVTGNDSKYCVFIFKGEISDGNYSAEKSIYKTSNERALEILILHVLHGAYNQIVFINPDGTEEAVLRHTHDPSTGIFIIQKYYELAKQIIGETSFSCPYKMIKVDRLDIKPIV
ncbi:hypothetical protein HY636_03360 [Candidatus Woesearchaeota archaeon]|nr:hypothetical protein [Candidatus Woesearchaeota archaeon]